MRIGFMKSNPAKTIFNLIQLNLNPVSLRTDHVRMDDVLRDELRAHSSNRMVQLERVSNEGIAGLSRQDMQL
jgi:hypothetical protein